MMYRLPPRPGEWIDRRRPLRFRFEGRELEGFEGDTLTSALAGAGVMTTARSFKYHRPRSLYSAAGHDAANLFQLGAEPNVRGDAVLLREGMQLTAVNTFGGVDRDRGAWLGWLSRFLPVGFYYKTGGGARVFPHFERLIRRMSGLGRIDAGAPRSPPERRFLHCDVAVIGAGISGVQAALAAAQHGATRVVLVDENPRPRGSALHGELAGHPQIHLLTGHCAVGYYADHELLLAEQHRVDGGAVLLRAGAVVLATGAIEQPPVFRNNDLPGVMLGSAAQRLLHRHAIAPGECAVIIGANAEAPALALELAANGVRVAALAMLAESPHAAEAATRQALQARGIELLAGVTSLAAESGRGVLAGVRLHSPAGIRRIDCDALLLSTGWSPAQQLALQAGAVGMHDATLNQHLPQRLPAGMFLAGRVHGVYEPTARIEDGAAAGALAAAHALRLPPPAIPRPARSTESHCHPRPLFPHRLGKEFVDLDEDLTLADLAHAAQEGFDSIELLKRYSTVGMGPSQGKLSNIAAARQLAEVTGRNLGEIGLTTARPPYQPISLGALAGAGHAPLRRTPMDAWHAAQGAQWMPAGNWRRPAYYARAGHDAAACIAAEVRAVRNGAALIDVSTLGKIDVFGADAAELLERLYTGRFARLAVGQTRYALMLDESGTVIDDGVVARLAPAHFYVSTTTGNSAAIYREMQRRLAEWRLDCVLHNLTGHMAAMNLAGPSCAPILAACSELALDDGGFPYLAAREGRIAGVAARVLRVGFVGERGYEIHVPADAALQVWQSLMNAGAGAGIAPFGVEAQRVLRLEKGHLIIGQDTDGITNPHEAGLGALVKDDKPFFVGQRSLAALRRRGNRQQLVGIELEDAAAPVLECHLVIEQGNIAGRLTSVTHSATLGRRIGLGYVRPALSAPGTQLFIRDDEGRLHAARVVAPPFYDPKHERQRVGALA
jgi:sarcosine oxidase subunit alpha